MWVTAFAGWVLWAPEKVEHVLHFVIRHSNTLVNHLDFDRNCVQVNLFFGTYGELYMDFALFHEFDCISEKID